jgi:hypothetical protein
MWRHDQSEAYLDHVYDTWIRSAGMSRAEPRDTPYELDPDPEMIGWRSPVIGMMLPAIGSAVRSRDLLELEELGLRTMVAIERHRLAHGTLPADLAALVPELLDELPIDPFATARRPLTYRVLPEADEQGRGYLLYSVGGDETDNDGAAGDWGTAVRGRDPGLDLIINQSDR